VGRPQNFLKVKNLHDCLGLADVKHLLHQNQSTVNQIARDLINKKEAVLVGEERFVGGGGEMILQDMQDQLVDDAKLNLVLADEPLVVVIVVIKSNHLSFCGVLFESIGQQDAVGAAVPLCKLLALDSRDFCSLREEINPLGNCNLHSLLTIGKPVLGTIKQAVSGSRNRHEKAPPEVFTLVLEELKELFSRGDRHVETNVIADGFGSNEPAFLIGFLGKIP
jgi:hypothetical protein